MLRHALRRVIKNAFEARGFEVSRKHQGGSEESVLVQIANRGVHPGTVIDVGVAYGTPDLYDAFPSARLLLVEPLREFKGDLEHPHRSRGAD